LIVIGGSSLHFFSVKIKHGGQMVGTVVFI
jgi:hypothetical protein